jgi:SAM-dependent methyltransferase
VCGTAQATILARVRWTRGSSGPAPTNPDRLPLPPAELRGWVGPRDDERYENPTGALVYPDVPAELYESVLDFGCGCGRVARQLILQDPRPLRYVGLDLHPEMVSWCQQNLEPAAPGFTFVHHDVRDPLVNPGEEKPRTLSFPVDDASVTLFEALSVFTHIVERDVAFYFAEMARVLRADGVANASFLLFEKDDFPPIGQSRNALYIDDSYPPAAVYYDRRWLQQALAEAGLAIVAIAQPAQVRGYQWRLHIARSDAGRTVVELPLDELPQGAPADLPAA